MMDHELKYGGLCNMLCLCWAPISETCDWLLTRGLRLVCVAHVMQSLAQQNTFSWAEVDPRCRSKY